MREGLALAVAGPANAMSARAALVAENFKRFVGVICMKRNLVHPTRARIVESPRTFPLGVPPPRICSERAARFALSGFADRVNSACGSQGRVDYCGCHSYPFR